MRKQVRVNLTMDEDVVRKAKSLGLNLSKTCENALIHAIKALEKVYGENNPEKGGIGTAGYDCGSPGETSVWTRIYHFSRMAGPI